GLVFSQKVLLALIEAGMSREAAYAIVQRHSMTALDEGVPLLGLLLGDDEVRARLDESALTELFDVEAYLVHVDESFRRIGLR
ncbi:MAG: adenylosuccinate lyase, partial [Chloroflexi bacterium]|nr:adenylosuccinate lyase [Chloroflexota bacterium]